MTPGLLVVAVGAAILAPNDVRMRGQIKHRLEVKPQPGGGEELRGCLER